MSLGSILFIGMAVSVVLNTWYRVRAAKRASTQRQYDRYILLNILLSHPKSNGELYSFFPYEKDNIKVMEQISGAIMLRVFYIIYLALLLAKLFIFVKSLL